MNSENHSFNELEVITSSSIICRASCTQGFHSSNTLQAFQKMKFHKAIRHASQMFGHSVSLKLEEFRSLYKERKIREDVLEKIILTKKGEELALCGKRKFYIASTFHTQLHALVRYAQIGKRNTASTWTR